MPSFTFSPLTAVGVGISGPSTKLKVIPGTNNDSIAITAPTGVKNTDSEWVNLGLTLPVGLKIKTVQVCYQIIATSPGATYIAQTRLSSMSTPNSSTVVLDDPTHQASTAPVCYISKLNSIFTVADTITLELKVVIRSKADAIHIGKIAILG